MLLEYHVNPDDQLLAIRLRGRIELAHLYLLCESILADEAFDRAWPQLVDARGIDVRLRAGGVKPFSDYMVDSYRQNATGAIAVVIDGNLEPSVAASIFRFVCGLPNAEVFDDYGSAIKWLLKRSWTDDSIEPDDATDDQRDEAPEPVWARDRNETRESLLSSAHRPTPQV